MTASIKNRHSNLEEITALYVEGEVESAFERLDAILGSQPEEAEAMLLKAEWSLERRRNPKFIGEMASLYRLRPIPSTREQSVVTGASEWAERALDDARHEIAGRELDDAFQSLDAAASLTPWEARIFLAKGIILTEHLPGMSSERSLLLEGRGGQFLTPTVLGRMRDEARSAFEAARELTTPDQVVWRTATGQLALMA